MQTVNQKMKNLKNLGNLTTPFGGKTRNENFHPGIDIANKSGTPIPAFASGTVAQVGTKKDGFGNVVILKDKNGNVHQYGHLQNALIRPGMKVKKGQPIGQMGKSGNTYSESGNDPSHLDLRVVTPQGKWMNPLALK